MLNYTQILAEQMGFPKDKLAILAGFGGYVGGLRPTQKALMCVGAATVACMLLGLTVKSMKKRGIENKNKNGNGNNNDADATGRKRKRMSINIEGGSQLNQDNKDTLPPQDPLQVDHGLGEDDTIAIIC